MAKKKEKKAGKRMKKKELVKVLLEFFHTKQDEVLSLKYIFEQLHLTTHPLKMLCMDILSELSMDDYITEVDKHKYKLNNHGVEMTGTFQRKSNGKNSFIPEGGGEPIFVAERNSAHAMNNDKVRIAFYAKRRGREAEGEVIEILERANDTFVGTLEVAKSYAFLVTENRTLANDIFIPKEKLKGGKTGDKAIVKVVEWPDKAKNPIGQVIDILGRAGDNTTEMHAILAEFGLPYVYPGPRQPGLAVTDSGGPVALRAYPSAQGQVITQIPNGTTVTVFGQYQGWYVVLYGESVGYANAAFIQL